MNAKEFCEAAIKEYEENEGHPVNTGDIFKWGSIGVAMHHLGMVKEPELVEYIESRAGMGACQLSHLLPKETWRVIVDRFGEMPSMRQIIEVLQEPELATA